MPDALYALPLPIMFLVLLAGTAAVAHLLYALPGFRPLRGLMREAGAAAPVLQSMMATFFALSVTFLSSSVWHTEDRAAESVSTEARGLRIIRIYADNMAAPARDAFRKMIADYAKAVALGEWGAEPRPAPAAEAALAQMYRGAITGFSDGETGRTIREAVLGGLDDISQARETRLALARQVVSPIQWTVVLVLGLVLLLAVAVCHEPNPTARGFALALVTVAIATSLFALLAHDRPFIGALALTPQPILSAAGI